MIRLAVIAFAAIAGIRRAVDEEAKRQGRGPAWWMVTASLFLVGGLAGAVGSGLIVLDQDDVELSGAVELIGGIAGGVLVALPAWVLLKSLRAEETEGPVTDRRESNWSRRSLIVLVPVALAVVASPLVLLFAAPPEAVTFVTTGLPPDVDGAVVGDHQMRRGFEGTIVVGPGQILDCDGHQITGSSDRAAVLLSDGATIRNCTIVLANTAVAFGDSVGATAERITATNNRIGFYMRKGTTGATIRNSYAGQNEIGYLFENSVTNASIESNVAEGNWGAGFQIGFTTDSFFAGNDVIGGGGGFWITDSHDNSFVNNTVVDAGEWFSIGVERGSSHNIFTGNEVSEGGVGIAVFAGAKFNEFRENDLHDNVKGAHTDPSAGVENVFFDNRAYDNRDVGLWDDGRQPGERYRGNDCHGNGDIDSVPQGLC